MHECALYVTVNLFISAMAKGKGKPHGCCPVPSLPSKCTFRLVKSFMQESQTLTFPMAVAVHAFIFTLQYLIT